MVSSFWYAGFRVVPYLPWSLESVPLASLLAVEDLEVLCTGMTTPADNPEDLVTTWRGGQLISCLTLKKKNLNK